MEVPFEEKIRVGFLICGRKLEYHEKTHTQKESKCAFHCFTTLHHLCHYTGNERRTARLEADDKLLTFHTAAVIKLHSYYTCQFWEEEYKQYYADSLAFKC